jgi:hypothetical protein
MQVTRFPGLIDSLKAPQAKKPQFQAALKNPASSEDLFVRRATAAPVKFGADEKYIHPAERDLVNEIYTLGGPKAATRDKLGFRISRHFTTNKTTNNLLAFLEAKDDETALALMGPVLEDPRYTRTYIWNGPKAD